MTVYVDHNVKFGKESVEGLRINPKAPGKRVITPAQETMWANAKKAYLRDGSLDAVLSKADMSDEHRTLLIAECRPERQEGDE